MSTLENLIWCGGGIALVSGWHRFLVWHHERRKRRMEVHL